MSDTTQRKISRREALRLMSLTAAGALTAGLGTRLRPAAAGPALQAEPEGEIVIWNRSGDLFQVFDATIAGFNQKYPKITVRHEAVDINAKLAPTLTTGANVPDGSFCEDVNIPTLAEHFYDITDWMQPYVSDSVPFKIRVNSQNGRIIGIPFDLCPGLLFYREDLLAKASVDPSKIATYDDLITAAKEVQAKLGASVRPIHLEQSPFLTQLWVEMFANQQGVSLVDAEGKLQINSEPYLRIMSWIKKVLDEGVGLRAEYFSPGDIAAIEADQVAFYPWAIWFVYGPENLFKSSKGLWRAMPLPAWQPGGKRGGNMGGSSFIIPKKARNPQLAWLFYEYLMFTPEGYRAVYGPNKIYPGGISTSLPS